MKKKMAVALIFVGLGLAVFVTTVLLREDKGPKPFEKMSDRELLKTVAY